MSDKTERFLERATAGLATDPELRLDVQAELRSHVEDKIAELGGDEHADEAVASLGEVVELAEEVSQANQRRLGWRNLARRALRFGLVPAAVVCALLFSDFSAGYIVHQINIMGGDSKRNEGALARLVLWLSRKEDPANLPKSLLLHGDATRKRADRYRTLWERHPDDKVFYANYITRCVSYSRKEDEEETLRELGHAQEIDPENGRYPILAAVLRAQAAADVKEPFPNPHKAAATDYVFTRMDRHQLDAAMADLLAGTAKPEYRTYVWDMLGRQLDSVGPPQSMADIIRDTSIAGAILLPDLSRLRVAARYSLAYARLLAQEGHKEEAVEFLLVPERLSRFLAEDAHSLMELMVVARMNRMARLVAPPTLRQMGYASQAEEAERRLDAVYATIEQWRNRDGSNHSPGTLLLLERGGVLDHMLVPTFGNVPLEACRQEIDAGRRMEFAVLGQFVVSLIGIVLLAAMLLSLVIALRWRFALGSQAAPLLLLPSWRDLLRFVSLGILLPAAVFFLWTRFSPLSGQAYSVKMAVHRTFAELVALAMAVLFVPAWLAARTIGRRCAELDLDPPPPTTRLQRCLIVGAAILLLVGFLMPRTSLRPYSLQAMGLAFSSGGLAAVGLAGAFLLIAALVRTVLLLVAPPSQGRTIGTLSRSLIPVFALAALLLSVCAQPILHAQERHLVQAESTRVDGGVGFTSVEARLVQGLRETTLQAMAANPIPVSPPP
jgi:hypothetical protein